MTTNAILDEAERRLAPAATTAQTLRQERRDAMYTEIGYKHLDLAKVELPKLEAFIGKEIRPFLARVESIGQRAKQSLPQRIQAYVTEMVTLCDSVPNTIRAGLDGWDRLTPPIGIDGKNPDPNKRADLIYGIRVSLMNHDGVQSRLGDLKAYVENYIRESGWPSSQPPLAA